MRFIPSASRASGRRPRAVCAGLSGGAGVTTGTAMCVAGGALSGLLPPWWALAPSALIGAALAGWLLAPAMGRPGLWQVAALPGAMCATALGAALGGLVFGVGTLPFAPIPSADAVTAGPGLGLLAVADGLTTSVAVPVVWALSMLCVHLGTMQARGHLKLRLSLS